MLVVLEFVYFISNVSFVISRSRFWGWGVSDRCVAAPFFENTSMATHFGINYSRRLAAVLGAVVALSSAHLMAYSGAGCASLCAVDNIAFGVGAAAIVCVEVLGAHGGGCFAQSSSERRLRVAVVERVSLWLKEVWK
ncbi:uncharacterized protein BDV17DRAFT_5714 [Aspergillus undulatus]|uniref:uncharacterized protein n=1 Tax=Aspergillus undulatus TaxID=1810928 RepID=UPI003CCDA3B5